MLVVAHHLDEIAAGFDPSELARVRVVGLRDGRLRFTLALERPAEVARALSDLYGATVEAVAIEGRSRFVVVP